MALIPIEIPRRSHRCNDGGEEITYGMEYYSLLVDEPNKGYLRFDYCPACWEKNKDKPGIHWKSKVPDKANMAQEEQYKTRNEKALYLLKEALKIDSRDEAFVLGLLLTRCKVLALRQQLEEENMNLYEVLATEEMLCVPKVALSNIQTETLQADLAQKLKG
jgi:hypothetical protein